MKVRLMFRSSFVSKRSQGTPYLLDTVAMGRFASSEPLLERIGIELEGLDWIIMVAKTDPYKPPDRRKVKDLVSEALD